MFSLVPTKEQWKKWSSPSKWTYIGAIVGIIALVVTIVLSLWPARPQPGKLTKQSITDSPNSINTIGQTGGSNVLINNPAPSPTILDKRVVSLNVGTQGVYTTQFEITVGNPPAGDLVIHTTHPPSANPIGPPALGSSGIRTYAGGKTVPYRSYLLSFQTSNQVAEGGFTFSLKSGLEKRQ
jgi:hypothetical protein